MWVSVKLKCFDYKIYIYSIVSSFFKFYLIIIIIVNCIKK